MMEMQFTFTQGLAGLDYKYKTEKCNYYSAQGLPRRSLDSLQTY